MSRILTSIGVSDVHILGTHTQIKSQQSTSVYKKYSHHGLGQFPFFLSIATIILYQKISDCNYDSNLLLFRSSYDKTSRKNHNITPNVRTGVCMCQVIMKANYEIQTSNSTFIT